VFHWIWGELEMRSGNWSKRTIYLAPVDPIFYSSRDHQELLMLTFQLPATRRVFLNEIFPNTDVIQGKLQVIYTLPSFFPQAYVTLQF
jgi:hypothetical protein